MEESLIKRLVASIKCTTCNQRYEAGNVSIVGHYGDLWFVGVICPTCRTQYLVAAVIKEDTASEIITDFTEAERDRFNNFGTVTADEMLDMHNFLKDFAGDSSRLFSQE